MTSDELKQIDKLLNKRFKVQDEKFKSIDERFNVLEKNINKKIQAAGEKVVDEIVTVMEETIFPKLEKMAEKSDIERLERRMDSLAVEVGGHEVRLKDIESIPAIAHELDVKKRK